MSSSSSPTNKKAEDMNNSGTVKNKFTTKTPSNEEYQQEYYKLIRIDKLLMLKQQRASNKLISIVCECGTISNPNQISAHRKTNKHLTLLTKSQSQSQSQSV